MIVASHIPGPMKRPSAKSKGIGKDGSKSKGTVGKRPATAMASSERATKDMPRKSKPEKKPAVSTPRKVSTPKSIAEKETKTKETNKESEVPELEEAEEELPATEDECLDEVEVEKPKKKYQKPKAADRLKHSDGSLKSFVKEEKTKDGWIVRTYQRSDKATNPGQLYYTYQEPEGGHTFYSKKKAKDNGFKE